MTRLRSDEAGFGLIELILALVLLNVGILATVAALNSGAVALQRASKIATASALADVQMESYRGLRWEAITLLESLTSATDATYANDVIGGDRTKLAVRTGRASSCAPTRRRTRATPPPPPSVRARSASRPGRSAARARPTAAPTGSTRTSSSPQRERAGCSRSSPSSCETGRTLEGARPLPVHLRRVHRGLSHGRLRLHRDQRPGPRARRRAERARRRRRPRAAPRPRPARAGADGEALRRRGGDADHGSRRSSRSRSRSSRASSRR